MKGIIDNLKSLLPSRAKDTMREGLRCFRMLTAPARVTPDFIIIGGQRCGSTSLYRNLTLHPCVVPVPKKEVHYFDIKYTRSINWYRSYFPAKSYMAYKRWLRKQNCITGEASPYYIFHPAVPKRIVETTPDVKLIAILRNPVDRAYSHYHHEVRRGRETLSFEEAIEREAERLEGEEDKLLNDLHYYSFNHHHYSYLSRGIYVEQLKRWMQFFPSQQMMIIKSEDFFHNPPKILKQIFHFLELPDWIPEEQEKYNVATYPEMDPSTRKHLLKYFEPHNKSLYELLGVTFDWWT